MDTQGQVIRCRAAVAWSAKAPLQIETVEVAPPKVGEVRVKIIATGVCHTDYVTLHGISYPAVEVPEKVYPVILGHEGAGIVESVGADVTEFRAGDHVIPVWKPYCKKCVYCKDERTTGCMEFGGSQAKGLMADNTTRFRCKGQDVFHFMGVSTFSQYTVVGANNLCKINRDAPLNVIGALACGIATGYGASVRAAKITAASTVAVFGLGTVGLAAVMGAQDCRASRIVGVDVKDEKGSIGWQFGLTDFVNPNSHPGKSLPELVLQMVPDGVDFALDCTGDTKVMQSAFESSNMAWGLTVVVGLAPAGEKMQVSPMDLLCGRKLMGTTGGGLVFEVDLPQLVEKYMLKQLKVDEFITARFPLEEINQAFERMHAGTGVKSMIDF